MLEFLDQVKDVVDHPPTLEWRDRTWQVLWSLPEIVVEVAPIGLAPAGYGCSHWIESIHSAIGIIYYEWATSVGTDPTPAEQYRWLKLIAEVKDKLSTQLESRRDTDRFLKQVNP